jgi:hypothetical protein
MALLIISPPMVSAITAMSPSYSVNLFGTGMVAGNTSSTGYYEMISMSEIKGTAPNAQSNLYRGVIGYFGKFFSSSIQTYQLSINQTTLVQAGSTYSLIIEIKNLSEEVEITSLPKITLIDPLKNTIVTNVEAGLVSDKKYRYDFTTSPTNIAGIWAMRMSMEIDGEAKQYNSTWKLSNGRTEISINRIDISSAPTITANITITNEDSLAYEYPYEYCIVSTQTEQCRSSTNQAYSSGYKLLNAGESWNPSLSLTVSQSGTYWFKINAYYGTQSSAATKSFSFSLNPIQIPSETGGSSGTNLAIKKSDGEFPILGNTINYPEHLMDVEVKILDNYKNVMPGSKILAKVVLYNLGTEEIKDAFITYCIKNTEEQEIKCVKETIAVYTRVELIKEFLVSSDMAQGRYYLEYKLNNCYQ